MNRLKRYNQSKRGSFQISLDFFDWELSVIIGSLRATRKEHERLEKPSKAYLTFLKRLEEKLSRALGDVLKAEIKVSESKRIIEEAFRRFDKIACAWSTGKDSTLCLYFARQVDPHIPVIFTDTMHHFKETYMFRDELAKDWKLNLIVARAETDYFYEGVDRLECCHKMKTEPFLRTTAQLGLDAVIVGVRRDEHPSRADEDYFSPREGHTRVHPILHWRWREVEEYTIRNGNVSPERSHGENDEFEE